MKRAFVLGNGQSRLAINGSNLKKYGTVYACNAIYRDFLPDHLIAVDPKMVMELVQNNVHTTVPVYTNFNNRYKDIPNLNIFKPSKGWSSGPTALWLASTHNYDEVYILGFDYQGLDGNKKVNNVYSNTLNYKKSSDPATFYGNWLRQTEQVVKEFTGVKYFRVNTAGAFDPNISTSNLTNIDYPMFVNQINYINWQIYTDIYRFLLLIIKYIDSLAGGNAPHYTGE